MSWRGQGTQPATGRIGDMFPDAGETSQELDTSYIDTDPRTGEPLMVGGDNSRRPLTPREKMEFEAHMNRNLPGAQTPASAPHEYPVTYAEQPHPSLTGGVGHEVTITHTQHHTFRVNGTSPEMEVLGIRKFLDMGSGGALTGQERQLQSPAVQPQIGYVPGQGVSESNPFRPPSLLERMKERADERREGQQWNERRPQKSKRLSKKAAALVLFVGVGVGHGLLHNGLVDAKGVVAKIPVVGSKLVGNASAVDPYAFTMDVQHLPHDGFLILESPYLVYEDLKGPVGLIIKLAGKL